MVGIENLEKIRNDENLRANYDEIWVVMRSYKEPDNFAIHVPELSPSPDLFQAYRDMVEEGTWNEQTFKDIYVPQFLKEMKESSKANELLNQLKIADQQNKKIALVCACEQENICHRSILAGLLMGEGASVNASAEYRKYWDLWKKQN